MTFKELGLSKPILKALEEENHVNPTEIQTKAIPYILNKKDLLGCAQTGTGKTAAFALPILQKLIENQTPHNNQKIIKALILSPTRELAIQTRDNFKKYGVNTSFKTGVILGGVNQRSQINVLRKGIDVLVATPGRLLDLVNQKQVNLNNVETLVLDEVDTLLDMGFIVDIRKIIKHIPTNRQTLLFSATLPPKIVKLAKEFTTDRVTVKAEQSQATLKTIDQSIYYVDKKNKPDLLIDILVKEKAKSTIIFTRTKKGADRLSQKLDKIGFKSEVIHGDKSQNARIRALQNFKSGKTNTLIATDIAARGLDINELSHVINYEIPEQAETYVHRIGRTGRAGLTGTAISLCDINEKDLVRDIQNLTNEEIKEEKGHEYPMVELTPSGKSKQRPRNKNYTNKNKDTKNHKYNSKNKNYKKQTERRKKKK